MLYDPWIQQRYPSSAMWKYYLGVLYIEPLNNTVFFCESLSYMFTLFSYESKYLSLKSPIQKIV